MGWWAMAWITAYDLTQDQKYLDSAKFIFDNMTTGWNTPCKGGIWWSEDRDYMSRNSACRRQDFHNYTNKSTTTCVPHVAPSRRKCKQSCPRSAAHMAAGNGPISSYTAAVQCLEPVVGTPTCLRFAVLKVDGSVLQPSHAPCQGPPVSCCAGRNTLNSRETSNQDFMALSTVLLISYHRLAPCFGSDPLCTFPRQ